MKKLLSLFMTAIFATLFLASCESTKTATATAGDQNKSDCQFEFGADVSAYFLGETYLNNLVRFDGEKHFAETNTVTFAPKARNADWHTHGEMYVIGVAGEGIYQEEGKEPVIIKKGDVIHIPAGVRHIHGATDNSWFQQIVIYDKNWQDAERQGE